MVIIIIIIEIIIIMVSNDNDTNIFFHLLPATRTHDQIASVS